MPISYLAAKPVTPATAPVASTSNEAATAPDVATATGAESDVTARTFQSIHTRIGDRVVATGNPLGDDAARERVATEVEAEVEAGGPTVFDPATHATDEVAVGALQTAAVDVAETKVAIEVAQRGVEEGHKDLDANPPASKSALWGKRLGLAVLWTLIIGAGVVLNSEGLVPMYAEQERDTAEEAKKLVNSAQPQDAANWGAPAAAQAPAGSLAGAPPVQSTNPNAAPLASAPIDQVRSSIAAMKEARDETASGRARARSVLHATWLLAGFTGVPFAMAVFARSRKRMSTVIALWTVGMLFASGWGILRGAPLTPESLKLPIWQLLYEQRTVIGYFLLEAVVLVGFDLACLYIGHDIADLVSLITNRFAAAERMARRLDVLNAAESRFEIANAKFQAIYRSLDMREHDNELRSRIAKAAKLAAGNAYDEAVSRNQTQILGGKGAQFMPPSNLAGNTTSSNNT